ncbi:MAG: hypothetical protein PHI44_01210 [Candidatus Ratteibacteria bacterium]|nr:hypothetical protein [Candidatus Ratteibacteria bacterium]
MRKKEGRDGVAMIMVLAMLVIFAALIVAVVISSTTAIRRAHFYKDKATALQVAQGGIEEVLYRMNYSQYDTGTYPAFTTPSEDIIPPGFLSGAVATLSVDSSCETKLISIGSYRGRTAQVEVNIKGYAHIGNHLKPVVGELPDGGIPEAFNKHTIYATQIREIGTIGTTVKGNITTTTPKPDPFPSSLFGATWTKIENTSIPLLSDIPDNPEDLIPPIPTPEPDPPGWNKIFKDGDDFPPMGFSGSYSIDEEGTETYTISSGTIDGNWIFEKADGSTGLIVKIEGSATLNPGCVIKAGAGGASPPESADIVLNFSGSNNPNIQGQLVAEGDITINVGVSYPNQIGSIGETTLWAGETITIDYTSAQGPEIRGHIRGKEIYLKCGANRMVITGNVYGESTVNFQDNTNTTDGFTINGDVIGKDGIYFTNNQGKTSVYSLITKSSLTIPSVSGFSLNIDSTGSSSKAGIVLYQEDDATLELTINGQITLTIGEEQVAGIMVYFDKPPVGDDNEGKTSNITISGNINFNDTEHDKFLLINQSDEGSITINTPGQSINGSIYSVYYRDTDQKITLTDGDITGSIITNGTVELQGGSITYDPDPYLHNSQVYKGFFWGRRRYVPVPGSWRVVW